LPLLLLLLPPLPLLPLPLIPPDAPWRQAQL
jgi:hypothetical protein